MSFVFKEKQNFEIELVEAKTDSDVPFVITVEKPDMLTLAKLAPTFQTFSTFKDIGKMQPKHYEAIEIFLREVIKSTIGWDGISNEAGQPIDFDRNRLKEIIRGDMTMMLKVCTGLMQTVTASFDQYNEGKEAQKN